MDYKEFSQKVKAKYPQYQDMDDLDLARRMVGKYPDQYSDVVFPDESQQQKPKRDRTFAEGFVQNVQNPFSQIARTVPPQFGGGLGILDAAMQPAANLFQAAGKVGTSVAENNPIGAVEGATRAASTLASAPFLPAIVGTGAVTSQLPESAQKVIGAPFNPAKTIGGENDINATIDNLIQGAASGVGLYKGIQSPTAFKGKRMKLAEKNILRSAPPKGEVNFNIQDDIKTFSPYLKEEAKKGFERGGQINRQTDVKINKSLNDFYNKYIQPQIDRAVNQDAEISLSSAKQKMQQTISAVDEVFEPNKKSAVEATIGRIPDKMTLKQANDWIKDLNAKTKKYENADAATQAQMVASNPALEAQISFKRALRDAIVDELENYGEFNTKQLRETYGSGARLRDLVHNNVLPAENQARQKILQYGGRATQSGIIENSLARLLGNTKEGEMRRGITRIGRYAENPPRPQVPNAELLNILFRNRLGGE